MLHVPASANTTFYNKGGICPQGSSQSSCRAVIPGTFPDSIGGATLTAPPITPEFFVGFGFGTDTVGSVGYSDPSQGDYIAFYDTNAPAGVPSFYCSTVGYLYHQRSGLCLAATAPSLFPSARYSRGSIQLQPCDCANSMPPEAQTFCARKDRYSVRTFMYVYFKGDVAALGIPYSLTLSAPTVLGFYGSPLAFYAASS